MWWCFLRVLGEGEVRGSAFVSVCAGVPCLIDGPGGFDVHRGHNPGRAPVPPQRPWRHRGCSEVPAQPGSAP